MPIHDDNYDGELENMVAECLHDESDRLTPWECEFLDDMHKRTNLTDKQAAVIERIWYKLFGD